MNAEKGLGGIDLTDTVTTTVEVASPAGHETFQLTQDQTMNLVAVSYTHLTLPTKA